MRRVSLILSFLFIFMSCTNNAKELVFQGKIIDAETNGVVKHKSGKNYVSVFVTFENLEKHGGKKSVEYRVVSDKTDLEAMETDKESLLKWSFCRGNIINVNAHYENMHYVEYIFTVQDFSVVQWSESLGQ